MKHDLVTKLQKKKQGRLDELKAAVESGNKWRDARSGEGGCNAV